MSGHIQTNNERRYFFSMQIMILECGKTTTNSEIII